MQLASPCRNNNNNNNNNNNSLIINPRQTLSQPSYHITHTILSLFAFDGLFVQWIDHGHASQEPENP